ncbi:MAG: class I SAM-dependent methyltransferase [Patescibacteria group bacterium]|nr:class I SAM-dependent methyltransferase [Patescibacteria group bacterium]
MLRELAPAEVDDMGLRSYLDGNWCSRKAAWGKVRVVLALANCQPDDVVLDFGCGTGILLALLRGIPKKMYACDINTQAAQRMVKELAIPNIHFLSPDELAQLPRREVTTIVAANVLEHVPDVTRLAHEFFSLLACDGTLVVSGPTENLLYRLGRWIVGFSGDYHVRTIDDIFATLISSGRFQRRVQRHFPLPGPACLYRIGVFNPTGDSTPLPSAQRGIVFDQ